LIEFSSVVITPTTGDKKVLDAIASVANQTYKNVKHLLVIDGGRFRGRLPDHIEDLNPNLKIVQLDSNTGSEGFYGHRIYAAFSFLVNEPYVFFLDQDNWYEPDHVESLIETINKNNYDWAYSLRNICNDDSKIRDNCESLGKWPVWTALTPNQQTHYHIDTSAYAFKRDFLVKVGSAWYQGYGGDRIFLKIVTEHLKHQNYGTSGKYTLNYRLDGNPNSLSKDFITTGNKVTYDYYKGIYPWQNI
jgi:GT2 family glycosyltransferase